MGVNIYILDRRRAEITVGGLTCEVGMLRRFWKITEINSEREVELLAAAETGLPSPPAVLTAESVELPLSVGGPTVKAHLLIGWDEGRTSVTDAGWDYLPILGYAVQKAAMQYVVHEEIETGLLPIDKKRASELGLIEPNGRFVRRGQPVISSCREIRPFIQGYAEADCTFQDGDRRLLLVSIIDGEMPPPVWLVGRTPREVTKYVSDRSSRTAQQQ